MSEHTTFGAALAALRKRQGYPTQTAFAKALGRSPGHISQLERDVYGPQRDLIEDLIERYNLPREEWLTMAGFGPPESRPLDPAVQRAIDETARRTAEEMLRAQEEEDFLLRTLVRKASSMEDPGGDDAEILQDAEINGYDGSNIPASDLRIMARVLRALNAERKKKREGN